ncbi:replication protein (plasmid) [Neobacillus sp. SCS-31]|uniref:replication protein n=1 Tax=Neobacillus oceani TaxID=3115292 RepID=UPI003905840E
MSGFTKLANDLLEQIAKLKLNGTQFRILMVVWRNTYGWQQKEKDMSLSFIATATEIHKKQVEREINALIKMNVITVIKPASFNSSRVIGFNENQDSWLVDSDSKSRQVTNTLPPIENGESTVSELVPSPVSESATQERKIKEISKEKDDRSSSEFNHNFVVEYEKHFVHYPGATFVQEMGHWIDNSQFKEPEAIICEVIKRAKLNEPNNPPKYIQSILKSLHNLGLFTLDAVRKHNEKFDRKFNQKPVRSLFEQGEESRRRQNAPYIPLTPEEEAELDELLL